MVRKMGKSVMRLNGGEDGEEIQAVLKTRSLRRKSEKKAMGRRVKVALIKVARAAKELKEARNAEISHNENGQIKGAMRRKVAKKTYLKATKKLQVAFK